MLVSSADTWNLFVVIIFLGWFFKKWIYSCKWNCLVYFLLFSLLATGLELDCVLTLRAVYWQSGHSWPWITRSKRSFFSLVMYKNKYTQCVHDTFVESFELYGHIFPAIFTRNVWLFTFLNTFNTWQNILSLIKVLIFSSCVIFRAHSCWGCTSESAPFNTCFWPVILIVWSQHFNMQLSLRS